ncbi:MAG TPA: kinase [Chthonomonadaceae bacterium]|nr:kinase [Chthonomonadaceae bacterium]
MIISRTPLRISFVGGGSDLPAYYRHEPGAVVSTAISKYIYINVNRKFDHKIRASYSVTEIVDTVPELRHELIREGLHLVGIDRGIEITSISDVHSYGTGLGSSSAYTVGLLNALYAYQGRLAGAERLAREACKIEIERCDKPIGKQDQYIAAFGGFQYIQFNPDGSVFVDPILCKPETKRRLQTRLLMLYTGITRSADAILAEQKTNTESDHARRQTLREMTQLAATMRQALCGDDLEAFGEILHRAWLLKRQMASGISSQKIDDWYSIARKHGAMGGKILGAGGGGFLLLYAHPEDHAAICAALPELEVMPFHFELQGSKIIYVEEAT